MMMMSDGVKKVCLATVEMKTTELPLVLELIEALRDDFDCLPDRVKQAVNEILLKDCK
jgi:hypothetical protein